MPGLTRKRQARWPGMIEVFVIVFYTEDLLATDEGSNSIPSNSNQMEVRPCVDTMSWLTT